MADPSSNVVRYLLDAAQRNPDRLALISGGGREPQQQITFAELLDQALRLSAGLRQAGLRQGDRAIVMIPMTLELYVCLLGLLHLGAVAVFVDPWMGARQIARFSAFANPRAFVGIPKSHALRLLHKELRHLPITLTTGRRVGPLPAGMAWHEVMHTPPAKELFPAGPDDPALITFTSGSSGVPKGANRTHGLLDAQHRALVAAFPYPDDAVDMVTFPVFGLNSLASGITCVIPEMDFRHVAEVDAAAILQQIESFGVSHVTASPPFFDRICSHVRTSQCRAPDWRRILTGGAPVTDAQLCSWCQVWPDTETLVVYGSTEAEPVAHCTSEERLRVSRVGLDSPGFYTGALDASLRSKIVRIHQGPITLSEAGWAEWEVAPGEIGELLVCGDHVCKDYFHNEAAGRENKVRDAMGQVWHRLGDTGYFDEQQHFWLTGRVHSSILRDGVWVHPQVVEQVARGEDRDIVRVAAVGMPHEQLGQEVVVVVQSNTRAGLEAKVRDRLQRHQLAWDKIEVIPEPIPVDPRHNSKIDYGLLRTWLEAGRRHPAVFRRANQNDSEVSE